MTSQFIHPLVHAFADLASSDDPFPNDLDLYEELESSGGSAESEETLAARLDFSESSMRTPPVTHNMQRRLDVLRRAPSHTGLQDDPPFCLGCGRLAGPATTLRGGVSRDSNGMCRSCIAGDGNILTTASDACRVLIGRYLAGLGPPPSPGGSISSPSGHPQSAHRPDTRAGAKDYDSQNRRGRCHGYNPAGRHHYDRPLDSPERRPPHWRDLASDGRRMLTHQSEPLRAPPIHHYVDTVNGRHDQREQTPEDESLEEELDDRLHGDDYVMSGRNQSASPSPEAERDDSGDTTPHDEPYDMQQPGQRVETLEFSQRHGYGRTSSGARDRSGNLHDDE